MSLDNSLMMEIYPFGGFLAYIKFHFIDGITKQSVMLLDKTRVDYDSKKSDKVDENRPVKEPKSDEEFSKTLQKFGFKKAVSEEDRVKKIRNELEK
jgi:hypothetical protein